MHFREATAADIPGIVNTFDGTNALPLEPRVRAALPALLRQMIASPACTLTVFEGNPVTGAGVFSCAAGIFVRDEVVEEYLANPRPGLASSVLAALLDGQRPLLTFDELRRANSKEGLTLAVFPIPYGQLDWNDPKVAQLRQLAPQAFMRFYAGYRLRAIYYEVFVDAVADYLQAGGYRLLHDFSTMSGAGFLPPTCRPRMLRLTRSELPPGAMSMATRIFDPPAPQVGLTPAEQRVALGALDGASDRAVAKALGLSSETVRTNWRSIYQRLAEVMPSIDARTMRDGGATRGLEKRRIAIEYLRQNMHELRPAVNGSPHPFATRAARR